MSEEPSQKTSLLDSAIVITLLPAYFYFCAFEYEIGGCNAYNIPMYLIEPGLTTVLSFAFSVLIFAFFYLKVAGVVVPLHNIAFDETKAHLKMIAVVNIGCILLSLLALYVFPITWMIGLCILCLFIFTNFFYWGFPLLLRINRNETLKEKLSDIKVVQDPYNILNRAIDKVSNKLGVSIYFAILLPTICYFLGKGESLKRTEYEVIATRPIIILKKYGDNVICRDYDKKSLRLGDSLYIMRITDEPFVLKSVKLGTLKL